MVLGLYTSKNQLGKGGFLLESKAVGYTRVPNWFLRSPDYTPLEKAIAIVIASYNPSYPSFRKIQEQTGIKHRSTIAKAIRTLQDKGIISIMDDGRKNNEYLTVLTGSINEPTSVQKMLKIGSKNEPGSVQKMNLNKNNQKEQLKRDSLTRLEDMGTEMADNVSRIRAKAKAAGWEAD